MGYYFATGHCCGCGRLFTFSPELVPSIRLVEGGPREPICASCIERANPAREANGLEPIWVLPGAYEAAPEHPYDDFEEGF